MSKFWDYNFAAQFTQGVTWTGSLFQSSNHKIMHNMEPGDSVIRSVIYGHVILGLSQPSGNVLTGNLPQLAASEVAFGLWYNKTAPGSTAPQGIPATPYDANWLQHDMMHLVQTNHYTDTDGTIKSLAVYNFATGKSESFGQRGPDVDGGAINLVWGFANPITQFWTENNSNYQGIFAAYISTHVLINHP